MPRADATAAPPPDDPRVVGALEYYLAELEDGRTPDREALLAEYADVAGPLADCLAGLDFLRTATAPPAPDGPDRLGDFRLIRVIGRGGMGVVYEAEQESLGRRVAVKTLPAAAGLSPTDLQRFRHEAKAAALLAHPHIVPVYAVGFDRGVHYFAMRLIAGRSLAELIARPGPGSTVPNARAADPTAGADSPLPPPTLPDPSPIGDPKAVARLALQAAEALAHAHARGVVHRDVKPANLLVDDAGHLWVADFGLAHLPGADRLTRTGALVGTLRYMSPEQVGPRRGAADHRADLYGLGATLYELLTGRPVVPDDGHGPAIDRILNHEPAPPRKLAPGVPRDLEAIVMTLLAKDPAGRYASADDLADDLRRFLAGEPVTARLPSWSDRAFRWAGKHRRLVAVTVAVVLGVVALQGLNQYMLARSVDRERLERQHTREAADVFYTHAAEQWLALEPGMERSEREFLAKARAEYDRLSHADGGTRGDKLAAAAAARRVADIDVRLGLLAEGEADYTAAVGRLRALAAEYPGWDEVERELATCRTDFGNLLRVLDRHDDAGREYEAAAAGFRNLVRGGSADPFDRAGLAGVENNRGLLCQLAGKPAEAEACFRSARAQFAKLAVEHPGRPAFVAETATCCHNLADVLAEAGKDDEADKTYREALALRTRAIELGPRPADRRELARTQAAFATLLLRRKRLDEAGKFATASAEARKQLAAEFPATPAYRFYYACSLRTLAEWQAATGKPADALRSCNRAADLLRPLVGGGEVPAAAAELARARLASGALHAAAGRSTEAERDLREAVAVADGLPNITAYDRQTRELCRRELDRVRKPADRPAKPGGP